MDSLVGRRIDTNVYLFRDKLSRHLHSTIQSTIFHKKEKPTMNTTSNSQAKPAKKLMLNKETIGQISSAQIVTGIFGPTAECTSVCSRGSACTTYVC